MVFAVLENVLLSSDVATMDAESEKLDELREDFGTHFVYVSLMKYKIYELLNDPLEKKFEFFLIILKIVNFKLQCYAIFELISSQYSVK